MSAPARSRDLAPPAGPVEAAILHADGAVADPDDPRATLPLIAGLIDALAEAEVRYCLWKSTTRLREALAGLTDLDLLVDERDREAWERVLLAGGFRAFISHPSRRYPGIEDRIGYDPGSGRLVHLHVHWRLVLGEHHLKNHALPLEEVLLRHRTLRDGLPVPEPEVELMVLTIRSLLKVRDTDLLKDRLRLGRRGAIPPDALRELRDLAGRVDRDRLRDLLLDEVDFLPPTLVEDLVATIEADPRDARRIRSLRARAREACAPYRREHGLRPRLRYLQARLIRQRPISWLNDTPGRREARRKTPARGGRVIVLLGIDGSGKSTMLEMAMAWLRWRLRIRDCYLGTARPSPLVAVLGRLGALARSAASATGRSTGRSTGRADGRMTTLEGAARSGAALATAVVDLAEAAERARRARAAHRMAEAGWVVLADRWPLPEVRFDGRFLDGPRIATRADLPPAVRGPLARLEAACYRRIPPPDHAIVLDVPLAVATGRRATKDAAALERRRAALAAWSPAHVDRVVVDASRPVDEVSAAVRAAIWRVL